MQLEYGISPFPGTSQDDFPPSRLPTCNQPKLIGLAGVARAGKDTVGSMLVKAFAVKTTFFAEPIKESLKPMLGLTDEHLYGDLKEVTIDWLGKSPRQIMQWLGTDFGRNMVNQDVWLLVAKRKIEALMADGFHVVVTDVRFQNEASLIREMGGTVWHIRRNDAVKVNEHVSEAGVPVEPVVDVILYNDGSLEELFVEVCDAF